jgi:hypothetical protein
VDPDEGSVVWLQVVRNFEDGDEDFDQATYGLPTDSPFARLSGQHAFLGWNFGPDRIALLTDAGMGLSVDEYG